MIITGLKPESTIDAEAFLSALTRLRPTAEPFRLRLDCTAGQARTMLELACRREVESRGGRFVPTPAFGGHLDAVAAWLVAEDKAPGLFLCGGAGNGKTTLLRAVGLLVDRFNARDREGRRLNDVRYAVVNARNVVRCAKAYDNTTDDNWKDAERYRDMTTYDALAIDDVGTEPRDVMVFGSYINAVTDLIYERYDRRLVTLISTNLAVGDMAKVYDRRVSDRLREMMQIVDFGNEPSFRAAHVIFPVKQKHADNQRNK